MGFYYFCLVLLFLFIFLLSYEIIKDIKKYSNYLFIILYCLILTILFKYNFGIEFWGLEYEDAYSFSFCSRQFSYNIYPSSFLIDAISIGSLENPISMFTYGGHFVTYPTFLSIFTRLLGWSPSLISFVNTLISFIILIILSLLGNRNRLWFIAPSLYCVAPIINVFTTCFLSEIFSSLLCVSFIYSYLKPKTLINSSLCFLTFGLALLCKRENLVLLFIPIINSLIILYKTKNRNAILEFIKCNIPYLSIVLIYIFGCQNIFNIESVESNDIGESTFSINNFKYLFPAFIKSLLSINTFSITFYAYVAGLLYTLLHKKNIEKIQWISIVAFSMYLILYTFHYRGYFFIRDREIGSFETYRYINNFYYFIPLFFSSFRVSKTKKSYVIISILLFFSLFQTFNLRNQYSILEKENRFEEVEIVSKYIDKQDKKSILITENILLYQNLCDSKFSVCDITHLYDIVLDDSKYDYYCLFPDLDYLYQRYGININEEDFTPILQLPTNTYLYKYSP